IAAHVLPVDYSLIISLAHHQTLYTFPTRRSSDLAVEREHLGRNQDLGTEFLRLHEGPAGQCLPRYAGREAKVVLDARRNSVPRSDRKSTRLNSSHVAISYAVFCLKKKKLKISYAI